MNSVSKLSAGLAALSLTASLPAAVLMLDFGPTAAIETSLTNSPYHSVNGSFSDDTWNSISADKLSDLLWSNGDAATDVTVNIGSSGTTTAGAGSLDLTGAIGTILGTQVDTGVFLDSSVARDAIYLGAGGSSSSRAVGVQIGGLAAGSYTIYLTGRNTNSSNAQTMSFSVGTSASAGNFNFAINGSSPSIANAAYADAGGTTTTEPSWSLGTNYQSISITLVADQYLNIAALGTIGDQRGFLNSVQIVSAIPEPSSFALLGGAAALLFVAGARRRPRAA